MTIKVIKSPLLRFKNKEGYDFPKWEKRKLKEYLIQFTEKTTVSNQYPALTSSRRGLYLQSDYFNKQIASDDNTGYNIVPYGYFTYRHMSDDSLFYFNINYLVENGIVSTLYPVFTTNKNMNSNFLKQILNHGSDFKRYSLLQKQGGSRTYMYFSKLVDFVTEIPCLEEQQKIADFFTLLDRRIEKQQEKVEALREYKKGMLQKIFSRELRFKDENGDEFPEWEEYTLNQLGKTYTGLSGKTKEDFGYGDHAFVTYINVFKNLFAKKNGIEKVNISDNENQALVDRGDIFFTTSSETPLEVGMASIWRHDTQNLHLNSFCFGYRLTTKNCLPEFLAITLRSEYMRRKIIILAQGSTRYNISKTELMKESVLLPSVEEQRKIIKFYLNINSRIELELQKLEALQEQKKGFIQQMFV